MQEGVGTNGKYKGSGGRKSSGGSFASNPGPGVQKIGGGAYNYIPPSGDSLGFNGLDVGAPSDNRERGLPGGGASSSYATGGGGSYDPAAAARRAAAAEAARTAAIKKQYTDQNNAVYNAAIGQVGNEIVPTAQGYNNAVVGEYSGKDARSAKIVARGNADTRADILAATRMGIPVNTTTPDAALHLRRADNTFQRDQANDNIGLLREGHGTAVDRIKAAQALFKNSRDEELKKILAALKIK
jgi:hypothetical protein